MPPLKLVVPISIGFAALLAATAAAPSAAGPAGSEPGPAPRMLPVFSFTDQWGTELGSRELRGRVWIASFLSPACAEPCPRLSSQLRELQQNMAADGRLARTRLVSFSLAEVTPDELARFAEGLEVDEDHWRFVTAAPEELTWLRREGFRLPPGQPAGLAALVDAAGQLRGLFDLLEPGGVEQLEAALATVLAEPRPVAYPAEVFDPPWLEARAAAQRKRADSWTVRHDFRFEDRREESGITFRHRNVADLERDFKQVHYDHGNGLAVADVDGDGLLDLYFTTQLGANELWKNLGAGRFENVTSRGGVALEDRISVSPSFADIDNDGDPDLFVTTVRGGNVLFLNRGDGRFDDVSRLAGLDHVAHSSGSVFFDYDRDGLLDLFVTNVGRYTTDEVGPGGYYVGYQVSFDGHLHPERSERSHLYRNLGNARFAEVGERLGLVEDGWNGDAHPIDFNGDGWLDLYMINMQGHDSLWENRGGERFVERGRELFPETPFGSMGISIFDFDNDQRDDIFIVDMHTDMFSEELFTVIDVGMEKSKFPADQKPTRDYFNTDGRHVLGNAFFHNEGEGRFREVSQAVGAENYWPWGLSSGDLNADGFEDVFIASSMNYPFRYHINSLLLNDAGKRFLDAEFVLGLEPRRHRETAVAWFDLDCSSLADADHERCAGQEGRITIWGALGSRSSVIFDLDDDGDLDIVTNEFNSPPMVLISDLAGLRPPNHLKVKLAGTVSNRDGLGARVRVEAGGLVLEKLHHGKSGYLAQSAMPLYFGLDGHREVDRVVVTWPSGAEQTIDSGIEVGELLTVNEPKPAP